MIENMEESILRTRHILQILHIINYQGINTLIEMEETIDILGSCGCILALEKSGRNIQDTSTWILLFYTDTYCLNKMCLTHSCRAENEQRIERLVFRIVANCLAYRTGDFISQ